ncbi:unnamed protein product [Caretta caretta]
MGLLPSERPELSGLQVRNQQWKRPIGRSVLYGTDTCGSPSSSLPTCGKALLSHPFQISMPSPPCDEHSGHGDPSLIYPWVTTVSGDFPYGQKTKKWRNEIKELILQGQSGLQLDNGTLSCRSGGRDDLL